MAKERIPTLISAFGKPRQLYLETQTGQSGPKILFMEFGERRVNLSFGCDGVMPHFSVVETFKDPRDGCHETRIRDYPLNQAVESTCPASHKTVLSYFVSAFESYFQVSLPLEFVNSIKSPEAASSAA